MTTVTTVADLSQAIEVIERHRAADPQTPIEQAVALLTTVLAQTPVMKDGVTEANLRVIATTLLSAATSHPLLSWESLVEPVVKYISCNSSISWTVRALIAKKLPSTLSGQNAWGSATVVKDRTKVVVEALFAQAELPESDTSAQERRIVVDAVHSIVGSATSASVVQEVAKRLVANSATFRALVPMWIAKGSFVGGVAATFYSAVEEALVAEGQHDELKLLPAAYEGKGSSALKSIVESVATTVRSLSSSTSPVAVDDWVQLVRSIDELIQQGDSNPSAFRVALSTAGTIQAIITLWGQCLASHYQSSTADATASSSSLTGASAHIDPRLSALRRLTMLIIYSDINGSVLDSLLTSSGVHAAFNPFPPTTTTQCTQASGGEVNSAQEETDDCPSSAPVAVTSDEGNHATSNNNDVAAALSTASTTPIAPSSMCFPAADSMDVSAVECHLLVVKKLLIGLTPAAIAASAELTQLKRNVSQFAQHLVQPLGDALKALAVAKTLLRQQTAPHKPHTSAAAAPKRGGRGPAKRDREDEVAVVSEPIRIIEDPSPSGGAGVTTDETVTTTTPAASVVMATTLGADDIRAYDGVLFAVHHLARYHASGVDVKVAPSWLR